jgi:flagellar motor component MotA
MVFLAFCAAGVLLAGGRLSWFVNVPAIAVVVGITAVLLLSNYSFAEMGRCFRAAYRKSGLGHDEVEDALAFFEAMQRYVLVSGFVGFLLGLITMLSALKDPSTMGSGTALALMTVLYGLILFIGLVVPFKTGLKRNLSRAGV